MARERGDDGMMMMKRKDMGMGRGMEPAARKEMMNRVFDAARVRAKSKGKRRKAR